ncbi:MAG: AAA family ATPase [Thermodesulfobacteriota bacterium]
MYRSYFGLREEPFALTPDPRFLYLSPRHREALAHLLYGMGEAGGFVQLTGEVGTGKTTLCRSLLEQAPEGVDVALLFNPRQTPAELVASVCDEFRVPYPPGTSSLKILTDALNRHLLDGHARGRRAVLVIDEAQNLSAEALEQVRLLTNLETTTRKLLQILLIGQPELRALMARPELRQLDQRITARYHLAPLTAEETAQYVRHRLEVAGAAEPLFTPGALSRVHRLSGGVPRLVNVLCDRALLAAYARGERPVGSRLVGRAAAEVRGEGAVTRRRAWGWAGAAVALALAAAAWGLVSFAPPAARVAADREGGGEVFALPVEPPPLPLAEVPAELPAPAAEPAATEPFGPRLAGGSLRTGSDDALATLFGYWGLSYAEAAGATACERAEALGLRCTYGRGNWTTLAHYGLPAVLELRDGAAARHHGVLVGLDGFVATLDFGGEPLTVPRQELDPLWFGEFLFLWQGPPEGASVLRLGSEGPDVVWLRTLLDAAEGRSPPSAGAANPRFGPGLRERVRAFQSARGLAPDGIAGEQTFIQLNTAAGPPSVPVLRRHHGPGEP